MFPVAASLRVTGQTCPPVGEGALVVEEMDIVVAPVVVMGALRVVLKLFTMMKAVEIAVSSYAMTTVAVAQNGNDNMPCWKACWNSCEA